eukprot:s683_g7.t1
MNLTGRDPHRQERVVLSSACARTGWIWTVVLQAFWCLIFQLLVSAGCNFGHTELARQKAADLPEASLFGAPDISDSPSSAPGAVCNQCWNRGKRGLSILPFFGGSWTPHFEW